MTLVHPAERCDGCGGDLSDAVAGRVCARLLDVDVHAEPPVSHLLAAYRRRLVQDGTTCTT